MLTYTFIRIMMIYKMKGCKGLHMEPLVLIKLKATTPTPADIMFFFGGEGGERGVKGFHMEREDWLWRLTGKR